MTPAGVSEAAAPVADEQRSPNFFFQASNALAQRRLGNMKTGGGPSEMQQLGENRERGEVASFELHTLKLSQACNHFIGRIAVRAFYLRM